MSTISSGSSSKKAKNNDPRALPSGGQASGSSVGLNIIRPNPILIPQKSNTEEDDVDVEEDGTDSDSHIPNEYDESELDTKIRYKKESEVDYSDPLDKRNHSTTIITPMSLSIAEAVKARRGRKRSRFNDIDREYLLSSFDPKLNSDMDDVGTIIQALKEDIAVEVEDDLGRDYAVQEDSDEDVEFIPSDESDDIDIDEDDKSDADYEDDAEEGSGDE